MLTQSSRVKGVSLSLALLIPSAVLFCAGAPAFKSEHSPPNQPTAQEDKGPAKLTFTKTLKGSIPEFCQITVDENGDGSYEGRKLDEASNPRPLKLSPATARQLFDLAAQLGNLQNIDLESHRRVANLGSKTLTYQQGNQVNRAAFNYTQNRTAQELTDLFEKVASVEQHITNLEFATKYDPLRLPEELLLVQIDLNNKALAGTELMVPTLEAIAKNPRFLHLAQTRAQDILQHIQMSN